MLENFLVIGAGSIGRRHIECLKDIGVENIYVCDLNDENCSLIKKKFDIKEIFSDIDKALKRHFDAALVATPTYLHADISCKVIEKEIPVIIEKPIEIDIANAVKIQDCIEKHNTPCLIAYCLRFDVGLQKIHQILSSGKLGKIYSVDINIGQYLPDCRPGIDYRKVYSSKKSRSGGICLDISHEFDYFRWLFGEPKKIMAISRKISDLEIDAEDIAEALIETENGTIGHVHIDYFSRLMHRQLRIDASGGAIEYDLFSRRLTVKLQGDESEHTEQFETERNTIYCDQLKHFVDCVKGKTKPLISAADAIKTLKFALEVQGDTYI
jgi:predicted dehydrogenase